MRGACVSWCALFTQRQPPSMRQERANVSRSLSALFILALSLFSFFSLSLVYFVSLFHPRPSNIGVDKPPMHCGTPRAIPANRGTA